MSLLKEQLRDYLKNISLEAKNVLSIGCQDDDKRYFKSCNVENWLTLDVQNSPDIKFDMNNSMIESEDGGMAIDYQYLEFFDYVLAMELWEYIYDPLTAHKNIYNLLKPGGTYIGSYVFIYPHHNPVGDDYLRYTDWAIKKYLTMAGFRDFEITPRIATAGREFLIPFVRAEGMKLSNQLTNYEWPIGYIVKARK